MKLIKEITKNECLNKMMEGVNIEIEGIDSYPDDGKPSIIVANHSCLMDIFYLAYAVPDNHVSAVSSRVMYKNDFPRKDIVLNSLFAMPIEPMSGIHSQMAIDALSYILKEGISVSIFPEGVYNDRKSVSRGRTGMARILMKACEEGVFPHYVPVAIDIDTKDENKNRYIPNEEDRIKVKILEAKNYESLVYAFFKAKEIEEKNKILHRLVDMGMQDIADSLSIPFKNQYIRVNPKENVMFQGGEMISFEEAKLPQNVKKYEEEVMGRAQMLVRKLRR